MTVYVRVRGQCPSVQLRSRSNHHGVQGLPYGITKCGVGETNCGFGNYLVKWSDNSNNTVMAEVEVMHPFYRRALDRHTSMQPPINVWTGYKQVTRNVGSSKVKVEGYILRGVDSQNWSKDTEYLFDGTNTVEVKGKDKPCLVACVDKGDKVANNLDKNTVWRNSGKWCWLRFEGLDQGIWDVDLKYFSVREIEPS